MVEDHRIYSTYTSLSKLTIFYMMMNTGMQASREHRYPSPTPRQAQSTARNLKYWKLFIIYFSCLSILMRWMTCIYIIHIYISAAMVGFISPDAYLRNMYHIYAHSWLLDDVMDKILPSHFTSSSYWYLYIFLGYRELVNVTEGMIDGIVSLFWGLA